MGGASEANRGYVLAHCTPMDAKSLEAHTWFGPPPPLAHKISVFLWKFLYKPKKYSFFCKCFLFSTCQAQPNPTIHTVKVELGL